MTKHKHYDLIVAKAANMGLVRFAKLDDNQGNEWIVQAYNVQNSTHFNKNNEYFLCLPQHAEACLHWLNGGEVEASWRGGDFECYTVPAGALWWSIDRDWMQSHVAFRIKPRKEKRWIAVNPKSNQVSEMFISAIDCETETVNAYMLQDGHEWQFIEIEVEV